MEYSNDFFRKVFDGFLDQISDFDLDDTESAEGLYEEFSRYVSGLSKEEGVDKFCALRLLDDGRRACADWWEDGRYDELLSRYSAPSEGCVRVFSVIGYGDDDNAETKTLSVRCAAATAIMYARSGREARLRYLDIPKGDYEEAKEGDALNAAFDAEMDIQCGCEEVPRGLWI